MLDKHVVVGKVLVASLCPDEETLIRVPELATEGRGHGFEVEVEDETGRDVRARGIVVVVVVVHLQRGSFRRQRREARVVLEAEFCSAAEVEVAASSALFGGLVSE